MKQPPLLPAETLARVVRLARLDGLGVLVIAGVFALLAAYAGDRTSARIGLLVSGAGAAELHGVQLLTAAAARGVRWLVASQLFLLVVVLAYCALRLTHVDLAPLHAAVTDEMRANLTQAGLSEDEFLTLTYRLTYGAVAVATFFYQGGMAVYYWRRQAAVAQALSSEGET